MNLSEAMPREFMGAEYEKSRARKFAAVEVVSEHEFSWPGAGVNVVHWVKLANGYAVGWNENPSKGWSFPVFNLRKKV